MLRLARPAALALACAGFWLAVPASAQTFVQARYAVPQTPQTTVSLAYSGAQTSGNLNVVAIGWSDSSAQVQSVTDSRGNSYALASGPTVQPGIQSQAIYYAANIASSAANTNAVTVTFTGAATFPDLRIAEYSGVATTTPLIAGSGASGNSTAANSGTVNVSSVPALLVGAGYTESVFNSAGTGYTQRLITSPNGSLLEDRVVTATGSYNATGTINNGVGWVMNVAAFRAAGGGGGGDTQAPSAPTGLGATAISSSQINLAWTAATDNVGVTGYRVERCAGAGCSNFAQIATPNATSYSDTGLAAGASYSYRVRAADAAGNLGAYSNTATTATSAGGDTQPPTAPSGLGATAISSSQIDLAWTAANDNVGVTGYRVERCTPAGCSSFAQIATPTATSYSDTGLAAGTSYSYRVRAADAAGNLGGYSNTATAATSGGGTPAPIAFVQARYAVPQTPQSSVTLAYAGAQTSGNLNVVAIGWDNATTQVQSVTDSRGNAYALAAGPTVQTKTQSQAIYYAANIASSAANANTVTVTFTGAAPYPDLRIAEYSGLSNSPLEAGRGSSGNGSLADSGAVTTTSPSVLLVGAGYTQSTFTGPGTGYTQRLLTSPNGSLLEDRIVAAAGSYNATAPISRARWVMQVAVFRAASGGGAGDTQPPTAPTLGATTISSSQIDLSWSGATDNVGITSYRLERCAGTGCGNFTQIATPTATIYPDSPLAAGTTYNYRVRAVDAAANLGAYSNTATATTSGTSTASISISTPTPGSTLTGTSRIEAFVTGGDIAGVQFMVDNVKVGAPEKTAPYENFLDTAKFGNGSHTISAYMWDSQGTIYRTTPVSVSFSNASPGNPAATGMWSDLFTWPLVSVHVNLSPNGTVLAWDHMATGNTIPQVWSPVTSVFTATPPISSGLNIFCSGHTTLRDGRVLVAGGHVTSHVGIPAGNIFDPFSGQWSTTPDMNYARWYPTLTALPDGRVLSLAGEVGCAGCNAQVPEIYDPVSDRWTTIPGATFDIPFYPHTFVLPNGKVLVSGSAEDPVRAAVLDLGAQTWTTVDSAHVYDAYSSAMYLPGKVVKSGTSTDTEEAVVNSSTQTYVLDMTAATPAWRRVGSMAFGRAYHTLTLLPDGNVLVTGGGRTTFDYGVDDAVKQAELWSPTTENWTTLAAGSAPRLYHSVALLLPDATVLVSGGGRSPGPDPRDQESAEVFAPPYLFKGPRPVITGSPATASYNQPIAISTPNAASIAKVSLVAVGNTTHGFNMNQRFVPLVFSNVSGTVTATTPANANLAPPGWYMLFLVDTNGVPSEAAFIRF